MITIKYDDRTVTKKFTRSKVSLFIRCRAGSNLDVSNILFEPNSNGYIDIGKNNDFKGYFKVSGHANLKIKNNNKFNDVYFYFPKLDAYTTKIGSNCNISDTKIHHGATVKNHVYIEDSILNRLCKIHPYAKIHSNTNIGIKAIIRDHAIVKGSVYNAAIIGSYKKVYSSKKGNPVYFDEFTQKVVSDYLHGLPMVKALYRDYKKSYMGKIIKEHLK